MSIATRSAFGETVAKLGETNPNIVVLDADLSKSTMSKFFAKQFPERFFEMGIAEANMIGTASGLAFSGKIPYICSFACFLTGRFDQIRLSIGYSGANVRLVGTHSGIAIGEDGYSQMGLEDIALMKSIPEMVVIQPADGEETKQAVEYLTNHHQGPAYLRLTRQKVPAVTDRVSNYEFKLGKPVTLRKGENIAIIATGGVVHESLKAAEKLQASGINPTVVNLHTIKPLDPSFFRELTETHRTLITVEDHQLDGGVGESISALVSELNPTRIFRIGVRNVYGESGSPEELYKKYQLDADGIAKQIAGWLK